MVDKLGSQVNIFRMMSTIQALANGLKKHGWDVIGMYRSGEKWKLLELQGFRNRWFNCCNHGGWLQEEVQNCHVSVYIARSIFLFGRFRFLAQIAVLSTQFASERRARSCRWDSNSEGTDGLA